MENQQLATTEEKENKTFALNANVLNDKDIYQHTWAVAQVFSNSGMVPKHYQGNTEGTFVALDMARELDINPMTMLQNTHMISGKTGMSASLAISLANSRGPFKSGIRYKKESTGKMIKIPINEVEWVNKKKTFKKVGEYEAENIIVTAYATLKEDDTIVESVGVSMEMAILEGWVENSKYRSMGEYMLRKRAANFLIREICPEVLMGLQTDEELQTIEVHQETPEIVSFKEIKPTITIPDSSKSLKKSDLISEIENLGGIASNSWSKKELEKELKRLQSKEESDIIDNPDVIVGGSEDFEPEEIIDVEEEENSKTPPKMEEVQIPEDEKIEEEKPSTNTGFGF